VLAEIRTGFFQECEELLRDLEAGLLALKQGERDPEIINTVFRAAHSIKGGGASFGLDSLVDFAHVMESVLAAIRSQQLSLTPDIVTLLLKAADALTDRMRVARDGGGELRRKADRDIEQALIALLPDEKKNVHIRDIEPGFAAPSADEPSFPDLFTPGPTEPSDELPAERPWTIRFRPYRALYASANEPLVLLRELRRLGSVRVSLDESELPLLPDLNPEEAYLQWSILLRSSSGEDEIRRVFEFVEGHCEFDISNTETPQQPASSPIASPPKAGAAARTVETIRVDLERIDRLIDLASELVIHQSMLAQRLSGIGSNVELPLDELDHLTRELQDSVMAIRAQPVKVVFQRLTRLVREVEAVTGKEVDFVTEGETTEVDRTVIERLTDPLTHMIRNAIDHGIETPEQRIAAGKPSRGVVRLSAAHRGGRVVIEARDDGRGINRERVRAVAVSRGLVSADASLNDEEIDNLIFLPGFSTAQKVSELSGRGVGMDVVRRGVEALGGRISVSSTPGSGSTFVLSLPLTLAILDGMLVSVRGHSLVVPLTALIEAIQPEPGQVRPLGAHATLMSIRGEYIPVIDLGSALGYRPATLDGKGVVLIVEDDASRKAALLVDDVLGQRQVVIKSVQANYRAIEGIAAATILGNGQVALIVDVNSILLAHGRPVRPEQLALAG
jgi:two-component system chemotaxis sensor kinase CheA